MTDPYAKLAELGLKLPEVTPPVAAYVPAVRSGNYVCVSGQLPMADGKLLATGKVGAEITPEQAKELAARCALNGLAERRQRGVVLVGLLQAAILPNSCTTSGFHGFPLIGGNHQINKSPITKWKRPSPPRDDGPCSFVWSSGLHHPAAIR